MSFKMDGFKELKRDLDKMINTAKEFEGGKEVDVYELLNDTFMKKHTSFASFSEMVQAHPYEGAWTDLLGEDWDKYVKENTSFDDWDDMIGTAGEEHIAKKMGF